MSGPRVAPVLSTPDTRILETGGSAGLIEQKSRYTEEELYSTYEISRTVREIREGGWKRIALQFPDEMLVDAPRVFSVLERNLLKKNEKAKEIDERMKSLQVEDTASADRKKLFILGDTSYGSCCVDEIAAEHVDADVVVHYGRSCLSPTSRLPVIYIFTEKWLSLQAVTDAFEESFPDKKENVLLLADIPYACNIPGLKEALSAKGYASIYATAVTHDPSAPIPNRTLPEFIANGEQSLQDLHVFHLSEPPASLLLTLSSRVASLHFFPCGSSQQSSASAVNASSALALRRRYALLTSLSTASIFGILINTLSVKNYMHIVEHVKNMIANAGKKSYTFVVGKVNAAKIANFSEVDGWIIIGCWESSLVENRDFWKPVITPFELKLALQADHNRIWSGAWRGDFDELLNGTKNGHQARSPANELASVPSEPYGGIPEGHSDGDSEPESAPPEFDLRTGKYVSHSRPMASQEKSSPNLKTGHSNSSALLTRKARTGVLAINGSASPAAEFLQSKRTWKGLGSDFEISYEEDEGRGSTVKDGRSGIASGYRNPTD